MYLKKAVICHHLPPTNKTVSSSALIHFVINFSTKRTDDLYLIYYYYELFLYPPHVLKYCITPTIQLRRIANI